MFFFILFLFPRNDWLVRSNFAAPARCSSVVSSFRPDHRHTPIARSSAACRRFPPRPRGQLPDAVVARAGRRTHQTVVAHHIGALAQRVVGVGISVQVARAVHSIGCRSVTKTNSGNASDIGNRLM